MSSRPGSSSGNDDRPEEDRPSTWSTAPVSHPGASFENPRVDYHASSNPNAERCYALDLSRRIIETTESGAREYVADSFPILDGFGNRVTLYDGELVAALRRHAEEDTEKAFFHQFDDGGEFIDMKTAMAEALSNETISYDFETKRFKRTKKASPKSTPQEGRSEVFSSSPAPMVLSLAPRKDGLGSFFCFHSE